MLDYKKLSYTVLEGKMKNSPGFLAPQYSLLDLLGIEDFRVIGRD